MTNFKSLSCGLLFLIAQSLSAQDVKGLHVNNFLNIIGDPVEEEILLSFAQDHHFNYLLLYNLYFIQRDLFDFTNSDEAGPLANFIYKAKTEYGIEAIGAVGEKYASFDKIESYNNARPNQPLEQFDVLHIEFEFWNKKAITNYYCSTYLEELNLPCDTSGAFTFYIDNLIQTTALAHDLGMISETYIGNPNASHCATIGMHVDRVMLHHYRKSDVYNNGNSIYNFKRYRLPALAQNTSQLVVLPIFSARSHYMGPWLLDHQMDQAFDTYLFGQNGFEEAEGEWKEVIDLVGLQWYRYTDLLYYTSLAEGNNLGMVTDNGHVELANEHMNFRQKNNSKEENRQEVASVYPSLTSDVIHINCPINTQIEVVNLNGNVVHQISESEAHNIISCTSLKAGMYFVRFVANGEWNVFRVTVVRK